MALFRNRPGKGSNDRIPRTVDVEFETKRCHFLAEHDKMEAIMAVLGNCPAYLSKILRCCQQGAEALAKGMEGATEEGLAKGKRLALLIDAASKDLRQLQADLKEACSQMEALLKEYKDLDLAIRERDARQLSFDTMRARFDPKSTSGSGAKRMMRAREEYQEASKRVLQMLADADGRHHKCLYMASLRVQEGRAMGSVKELHQEMNGQLSESLRPSVAIWNRMIASCTLVQERISGTEGEVPLSPKDVPLEGIQPECSSPTGLKPVRILRPAELQHEEAARIQGVSRLKEAFESKHKGQAPDADAEASPPSLPSGKSRVAALAAQLEVSKIIFRPMAPNARPKLKRDTDLEEEELARPFNPFAKRFPQKKRLEVPPKAPKKDYLVALFDYSAQQKGDLAFRRGDKIELLLRTDSQQDWWTGRRKGTVGLFPANYTRPL